MKCHTVLPFLKKRTQGKGRIDNIFLEIDSTEVELIALRFHHNLLGYVDHNGQGMCTAVHARICNSA